MVVIFQTYRKSSLVLVYLGCRLSVRVLVNGEPMLIFREPNRIVVCKPPLIVGGSLKQFVRCPPYLGWVLPSIQHSNYDLYQPNFRHAPPTVLLHTKKRDSSLESLSKKFYKRLLFQRNIGKERISAHEKKPIRIEENTKNSTQLIKGRGITNAKHFIKNFTA